MPLPLPWYRGCRHQWENCGKRVQRRVSGKFKRGQRVGRVDLTVGSEPFKVFPDGDGQGPGAGTLAADLNATFGSPFPGGNTNVYGNTLLSPLIGGSGGAGRSVFGGGGGGGAILIASSTKVLISGSGGLSARGGAWCSRLGRRPRRLSAFAAFLGPD